MFNTSFLQILILMLLVFVLFGDFKKFSINFSDFKNLIKKSQKKNDKL